MLGDRAPLADIVSLKNAYNSTVLRDERIRLVSWVRRVKAWWRKRDLSTRLISLRALSVRALAVLAVIA